MGASVSLKDINIAHRVPLRDSTREGPKSIVCKFTRRLARNDRKKYNMAVCREASKVSATAIGLEENINMANARVVDHLTPRMLSRMNITLHSVG